LFEQLNPWMRSSQCFEIRRVTANMHFNMCRGRCVKKSPQGPFEERGILLLRPKAACNNYQVLSPQVHRLGNEDVPDSKGNGNDLLRKVGTIPPLHEFAQQPCGLF
jgi:hypothetical protein